MKTSDMKRLFFALETHAPWPDNLPSGRHLAPDSRHLTLAFLGETPYQTLLSKLKELPPLPFQIGFGGVFDECLFLPFRRPNVVAWHVHWLEEASLLNTFQKDLVSWLIEEELPPYRSDRFLPHVTLCRKPFKQDEWKKTFVPLPLFVKDLHLYESLGQSKYRSIWSFPILAPFEEIEHTADIAFLIRGTTLRQIYLHAQLALAFTFPPLLSYLSDTKGYTNLDDVIIDLNDAIGRADGDLGCPFKAVSFHGEVEEEQDQTLTWEMIVDV